QDELLTRFQGADVDYPRGETIVTLFAEQVRLAPEKIAVVFGDQQMTYRQLDQLSSQLAHFLIKAGVGPDTLVPICLERSMSLLTGLLGILKAGGAYVPVDPDYPQERINYMIRDTAATIVLTDEQSKHILREYKGTLLSIDGDWQTVSNEASFPPDTAAGPANLAYVIYTSGSTGKPKGVLVEHRNVVRLFMSDAPLYSFSSSDIWTLFHSFCFDFSVWEIFGALFHGGRLVIVSKEMTKDVIAFANLISAEGVTVLNQTPGAFYVLQEEILSNYNTLALRYVIFGGEALSPSKLYSWKKQYPDCLLINMYGITETTVHVTYKEIDNEAISRKISNIGKPIPTLCCYILNRSGQPQPIGVPGELFIGGAGVSRGYLNREELTAERFVNNPFGEGRLYRTGDLGRWLADGNIEYLGRMDDQVKIRGYRIELGEIEAAVLAFEGIREA
ncbi:amino acid adenylation domain-containing protein, partial [Mucilaginibacter sp. SG538B]|uniref:non-ribosomal peptide synthetase n=1 Tax=Mucilaginibacter sp. SG538B TaxID=2587021 RepID=UPI00159D2E4E